MAALDDGLYDVGGEICKPQEPADVRFAEAMALRNLSGIDSAATCAASPLIEPTIRKAL